MNENEHYQFIVSETDQEYIHIKLISGPYKDTIFKYGKINVEEKNDEGYLHFDYDVLQSNVMKPKKLEKNKDFQKYIGDLLVEIIARGLEEYNESRTTDTEESDL